MSSSVFLTDKFRDKDSKYLQSLISCKSCGKCCNGKMFDYILFGNSRIKLPCKFHKNNRCSIYSSRPINCRLFPFIVYNGIVSAICIECPAGEEIAKKYIT